MSRGPHYRVEFDRHGESVLVLEIPSPTREERARVAELHQQVTDERIAEMLKEE